MNPEHKDLVGLYLEILNSPEMRWLTLISIASIVIVCVIAWRKNLNIWTWFLYSVLLGPVALVHILFKTHTHTPPESPGAL